MRIYDKDFQSQYSLLKRAKFLIVKLKIFFLTQSVEVVLSLPLVFSDACLQFAKITCVFAAATRDGYLLVPVGCLHSPYEE